MNFPGPGMATTRLSAEASSGGSSVHRSPGSPGRGMGDAEHTTDNELVGLRIQTCDQLSIVFMATGHSFSEDEDDDEEEDPLTCASRATSKEGATGTTSGAGISRAVGRPPLESRSTPREGLSTERSCSTDFAFPPPSPAGSLEECLLSPSVQGSTATPSADSQGISTASTGMSFSEGLRDTPDVDSRGLSTATPSVGFSKGSTAGGNESHPNSSVLRSLRAIVLMASGRSFSDEEEEDNQEDEEAKVGGNKKHFTPCPSVVTPTDGNAVTTGERSKLATSATPGMVNPGTELTSPLLGSTSWKISTITKCKRVERTGWLYKRRHVLRGRFARTKYYAELGFVELASMRRGAGATRRPFRPPTLTLRQDDKFGAEKVVSLEGAKVTVATSKVGNMFPFVVSFPSTPVAGGKPTATQKQLKQTGTRMPATRRKPLRLACDTIWQTKAWASCIKDAVARHESALVGSPGSRIEAPVTAGREADGSSVLEEGAGLEQKNHQQKNHQQKLRRVVALLAQVRQCFQRSRRSS